MLGWRVDKVVDNLERSYLFRKRGIFYFSRHVPADLRAHYSTSRIVICLRTRNPQSAHRQSRTLLVRLEDYWAGLRLQKMGVPGSHLLVLGRTSTQTGPTLEDALETYLRLKGTNKGKVFERGAVRNVELVVKHLGNRFVGDYASSDAALLRDHLLDKGLKTASVRRIFATLRSIVNLTLQEEGIRMENAFSRTFMPDVKDSVRRIPIPTSAIQGIQNACLKIDDEMRWLVALVSDTGMRLSEAAGLARTDIMLDDHIPYVSVREHPWRRLKTGDSERTIPLVGASLWACRRALQQSSETHLFPRYNKTNQTNSNSASAALNKWLKAYTPEGCVVHSFRHSMRDRLRAVECPSDVVNRIGGWKSQGVGEQYGQGYPLDVLQRWLLKVVCVSDPPSQHS